MLEDYRKVMVDRRGEEEQFSSEHIVECMKKGTTFVDHNFVLFHLSIIYSCLLRPVESLCKHAVVYKEWGTHIYRSKVGNYEELKVSNAKFLGPGQSLHMSPCSSGRLFIWFFRSSKYMTLKRIHVYIIRNTSVHVVTFFFSFFLFFFPVSLFFSESSCSRQLSIWFAMSSSLFSPLSSIQISKSITYFAWHQNTIFTLLCTFIGPLFCMRNVENSEKW